MIVEQRLEKMGIELPPASGALGSYVNVKKVDSLIYVSGQGPIRDGKIVYVGKVGAECTKEEGYDAAKISAINIIAQLKSVVGDLDNIETIVNLRGFVASSVDFYEQPYVINGASDLIKEAFGEVGDHTRCALGTSVLPMNIPVEVELVAKVKE